MHIELLWPQITYCSSTCKVSHTVNFLLVRGIEWSTGLLILTSDKFQKKARNSKQTKTWANFDKFWPEHPNFRRLL